MKTLKELTVIGLIQEQRLPKSQAGYDALTSQVSVYVHPSEFLELWDCSRNTQPKRAERKITTAKDAVEYIRANKDGYLESARTAYAIAIGKEIRESGLDLSLTEINALLKAF